MSPKSLQTYFLAALMIPPLAGWPAADATAAPPLLQTVVVSGEQPGPGLWKVSRDGHVLWILGTVSPLPKRMVWRTDLIERTIAQSQEMLSPPQVEVRIGGGWLRGLLLLPSALGVRKNPNGEPLSAQVSAELYARWLVLKNKYMPFTRNVESWRPLFAAAELYGRAIRRIGLTEESAISRAVAKLAKRHDVPRTVVRIEVELDDPKSAIREFSATALEDSECFAKTLSRLESDLRTMAALANAWAIGDIAALRELPRTDPRPACLQAVLGAGALQRRGFDTLPQRLRTVWLTAAETALAKNSQSFATLSMGQILADDGYLAELKRRGYAIEPPE